jgi:3-mercaptopyruvate sulfurtransferase SseA
VDGRGPAGGDYCRPVLSEGRFEAVKDTAAVRDLAQMKANVANRAEQVIDARSALRFGGGEPEPRAGVSPGHIRAASICRTSGCSRRTAPSSGARR